MAGELIRPGVQILQTFASPAPSINRPSLVPCIVGPAFEVIPVLNADATINANSKYGTYSQLSKSIAQSAYPDHRGNIDELNVLEDSVRIYMLAAGKLDELPLTNGSAFLATAHGAGRAAMRTKEFGAGLNLVGKVLKFCIDNPTPGDTSNDVTVLFTGEDPLSPAEVASQLNDAVGSTVATVPSDATARVQIASSVYGALSSITIRAGGSANAVLELGYCQIGLEPAPTADHEERVEGSGWRGQEPSNGSTQTSWIEFYRGAYKVDDSEQTFVTPAVRIGIIGLETETFGGRATAVEFGTTAGKVPLVVGDYVYADGVRLLDGEVMRVEADRFRMGTINRALSTADQNGNYVSKVYDAAYVGTMYDLNPFAPKYMWFKANDLNWMRLAPVADYIKGTKSGTPATQGSVSSLAGIKDVDGSGNFLDGPGGSPEALALGGYRIHYVVTVDGEETDALFTFTGQYDTMAELQAAIVIPGVTSLVEDVSGKARLTLKTTAFGRLQVITVKADSTAYDPLKFRASTSDPLVDVTGTGTDVMFNDVSAVLVGGTQTFPFTTTPGETLVVETSADGGSTWTAGTRTFTVPAGGPYASITDLLAVINANRKSVLDLSGPGSATFDTVVEAVTAGVAGNSITVASVADGTGTGSLTRVGTAFTIHYESGVTKVSDVESLITALTGDDKLIVVKTAGTTPLYTLTAPDDTFIATSLADGGTYWDSGTVPSTFTVAQYGAVDKLVISSVAESGVVGVRIGSVSTAIGTDSDTDLMYSSGAYDIGEEELTGQVLKFKFDHNPHVYEVSFASNSLDQAIDDINEVVGVTVAEKLEDPDSGDLLRIKITSPLEGLASYVEMVSTQASQAFGLGTSEGTNTGRPYPDAYMDSSYLLHVQAEILRDTVTGYPLDQDSNSGVLYIQYKALRLDVSPRAKVPGILRLSDSTTLGQVLDPISEENPLALGLYLCMLNAPTYEVKALGVDEVSGSAPEGTGPAWSRVAGMLESEEVFAIAPLTQDEVVIGMWGTHCVVMSAPEQGGERIVFVNKVMPTRRNPTIALSGTAASTTDENNQVILDADPSPGLIEAGVPTPLSSIDESVGVYAEFEVSGEVRKYNVSGVTGALVNLRTTFSDADTNADGFYSDVELDPLVTPVTNATYGIKVRGAEINIPGTDIPDYSVLAETVGEANATYANRRMFSVFPDTFKITIDGSEKALPGYYACAAIAGMVGAQPPQQGFTNFPIAGLVGVVGTEKFTKRQLNTMAGGGTYILIQDVQGGAVTCRHQVSTDTTSIEVRELSITKVVDITAKILRIGIRKYIGVNIVNEQLLSSISTAVNAILRFLEETGVLNGSTLNNILQDSVQPDKVLIDVTLDVPYPCNYIQLVLEI